MKWIALLGVILAAIFVTFGLILTSRDEDDYRYSDFPQREDLPDPDDPFNW